MREIKERLDSMNGKGGSEVEVRMRNKSVVKSEVGD